MLATHTLPVASVASTLGPQPNRLAAVGCIHATQLKSAWWQDEGGTGLQSAAGQGSRRSQAADCRELQPASQPCTPSRQCQPAGQSMCMLVVLFTDSALGRSASQAHRTPPQRRQQISLKGRLPQLLLPSACSNLPTSQAHRGPPQRRPPPHCRQCPQPSWLRSGWTW